MRLAALLALAALTTAVPMGSSSASATSGHSPEDLFTPKPAPTWTPKQAAQNEALIKQNAKDTADPTKCPMNHPYQACCRTLTNIADAIFKPIGEIIPQLKGANLASPMSFECKPMTPGDPPEKCAHQASCCGSDPKEASAIDINSCTDYREEMNKTIEALERNKKMHSRAVVLPVYV
ncbi:predicted protein [Aspergillus terreus NIH2624]|uniref:Hydrophobin n=1 Tax=Aspergillus terreus (strain NIH 2624 / FGSC A1156) TaxID=341663 RepID=Q0CDZ5_ASPTN|nr:uncharacterized protein ATEG_08089 [Aspergillus terreus NIH2624]EAU31262.1 predicted protein [Aspergillus terreus NIH2624]